MPLCKPTLPKKEYTLSCQSCGNAFIAGRPDKKYCSFRCQSREGRKRRGEDLGLTQNGRSCYTCGAHVSITPPACNRRYCSNACAKIAAKKYRRDHARRHPGIRKIYEARRNTPDTGLVSRLRRRFPELPKSCQACGENRVVEIAHRPEYRRGGAWRKIENSKPDMVWVLCPTCHKLLDRGICSQEELGLK